MQMMGSLLDLVWSKGKIYKFESNRRTKAIWQKMTWQIDSILYL